jgi:hypothetical protein
MLRKWPPILWVIVYVASLFILMGGAQGNHTGELIAGIVLVLIAFGEAMYLATRGVPGAARPWQVRLPLAALALFYILCAVAAGTAGPAYAVAGLAAGLIPLTALCLLVATARAKTAEVDGSLRDLSAEAHDDPFPGIGFDDRTPLGDTPEHADAESPRAPDRPLPGRTPG